MTLETLPIERDRAPEAVPSYGVAPADATVSAAAAAAADDDRGHPRGFALTFLGTCAVVLLVLYGVNFLANTNGLFPNPLTPAPTERAWKTRRLDDAARRNRPLAVFILGSSRVMQVQPAYVEAIVGKPTFNYGVSAAGPVDFLAQLRFLLARGFKPSTLIVGVDEFSFGRMTSQYELQTAGHWRLFQQVPPRERLGMLGRILSSLTPATTWNAIKDLSARKVGNPGKRNARRTGTVLLGDGYLIYEHKTRAVRAHTYDYAAAIAATTQKWVNILANGSLTYDDLAPEPRHTEVFRQFLALARANGIDVKVMLLPLHPDFERDAMTRDMAAAREQLNILLVDLCARHAATYRDFRRLDSFGGDPAEFWDGAHQRPENLRRMTNALFGKPPAQVVARVPSDFETLKSPPKVTSVTLP